MKNIKSIAFLLTLILFVACSSPKEYVRVSGDAFGTMYNITYEIEDGRFLKQEIDSVLKAFDASLSTYNPNSSISKINRGENIQVDAFFEKVFKKSIDIGKKTRGDFDVTIAPIVNAWGFGFKKEGEITKAKIDSLLLLVGYGKVQIKDGYVQKESPRVMFDFNAIAKGFGVDVVADYLTSQKVENYLVEIGGEIVARGKNPHKKNWSVGVDRPEDNASPGANLEAVISFTNKGLATSGNYRRFYIKDGVKYAHTINPKTGYPVQHSLLSATVIADDCMTADAYATAFMVMGVKKTIAFLKNEPKLDVLLIFSGKNGELKVWQTKGMEKLIRK